MNTSRICTIAIVLAFAACGPGKKALKSPSGDQLVVRTETPAPILYPEGTPQSERIQERRTDKVRPAMHFTELESTYVRLANTPGLPADGLAIPLAELQEEFCYPYRGPMTSEFGIRNRVPHTGIDISAVVGDTIRSALDGVVRMSKYYGGYGNVVVIRHYNNLETVYGHNIENLVKVNDAVRAGQPIALAGRTGKATGYHLHFEVRAGGEPVDPQAMVDVKAMKLRDDTLYVKTVDNKILAYNGHKEWKEIARSMVKEPLPKPYAEQMAEKRCNGQAQAATQAQHAAQQMAAERTAAAKPQPREVDPNTDFHVIERGESMSVIARKYGLSVAKLCEINGIENPDQIYAGQKLMVRESQGEPAVAQVTAAQASASPAAAKPEPPKPAVAAKTEKPSVPVESKGSSEYHVVVKGNTLSAISRQYGVAIDKICELNSIERDAVLALGQKVRVK